MRRTTSAYLRQKEQGKRKYRLDVEFREQKKAYARDYQKRGGPRANRLGKLKHKYRLTHEQYLEIAFAQDFRCAICLRHESELPRGGLHVDHDHITGAVRGLLCVNCNVLLGRYERHKTTIDIYLQKAPILPAPNVQFAFDLWTVGVR